MTYTPDHIKALQLKIWLSKPPMERLRQMMTDNEALLKFWSNAHKINDSNANSDIQGLEKKTDSTEKSL